MCQVSSWIPRVVTSPLRFHFSVIGVISAEEPLTDTGESYFTNCWQHCYKEGESSISNLGCILAFTYILKFNFIPGQIHRWKSYIGDVLPARGFAFVPFSPKTCTALASMGGDLHYLLKFHIHFLVSFQPQICEMDKEIKSGMLISIALCYPLSSYQHAPSIAVLLIGCMP